MPKLGRKGIAQPPLYLSPKNPKQNALSPRTWESYRGLHSMDWAHCTSLWPLYTVAS